MATLEERLSALAIRAGAALKTGLAGKADDSATVHRTGAETINGTKTFGSSPIVPTPSAVSHPVRNDDSRLTDARIPVTHTHASTEVAAAPRTIAYGTALTAFTPLSGTAVDLVSCTLTGNPTITPATGADRQVVRLALAAGGSARTVTFASGVRLGTGITDRAMAVPAGQIGVFGIEYFSVIGAWVLFSEYASAT